MLRYKQLNYCLSKYRGCSMLWGDMENNAQNKSNKLRSTVQSLDRGLLLLDYVVSAEGSVALGELANLVGVEKIAHIDLWQR